MTGLGILVALAATGVDYGWQANDDGKLEYIIQIEPELLESLRDGRELASVINPDIQGVTCFRIRVGNEPPPREPVASAKNRNDANETNDGALTSSSSPSSSPTRNVTRREPLGDPNYASALGGTNGYGASGNTMQGNVYGQGSSGTYTGSGYTGSGLRGTSSTTSTSSPSLLNQQPAANQRTTSNGSTQWSDREWNTAGSSSNTIAPTATNANNSYQNWDDASRRAAAGSYLGGAAANSNTYGATGSTGLPAAPSPYADRYTQTPGGTGMTTDSRGYTTGGYVGQSSTNSYGGNQNGYVTSSSTDPVGTNDDLARQRYNNTAPDLNRRTVFGTDTNPNAQAYQYGDRYPHVASNQTNTVPVTLNAPNNGMRIEDRTTTGLGNTTTSAPSSTSASPDRSITTTSFPPIGASGSSDTRSGSPVLPRASSEFPSSTSPRATERTKDDEESGSSMLAFFALFISLSGNAYLTWICWGIHERYRKLATQVSRSNLRAHSETAA